MSRKHHVPENGYVTTTQKTVYAGVKPSEEKQVEIQLKKLAIYNALNSYDVESRLDNVKIYLLNGILYFVIKKTVGPSTEHKTPFTSLEEGQEWLKKKLLDHLQK